MGARIMLAAVGVLGLCAGLWAGLSEAAQLQYAGKEEGQGGVSLVVLFGVFAGLVTLVAALWFVFAFADSDPAGRTVMLKGLRSFALLFLAMLAGMIASVLVANGRAGRFDIPVAQLITARLRFGEGQWDDDLSRLVYRHTYDWLWNTLE